MVSLLLTISAFTEMVFIYLQKNCDLCLLLTLQFCSSSFSVSIPMSRRVTDPCQVNPCQNGGVCLSIPHSPLYECSCPESFSGRLCEQSGWNYSLFKFTRRHIKYQDIYRILFAIVNQSGLTSACDPVARFQLSDSSRSKHSSTAMRVKSCSVSLCLLYCIEVC